MISETTTTFGLLRHGETEWNSKKKIQGSGDSPLTDKGRKNTAEWANTLSQWSWNRIIASDLGRVKQTVAILNNALQLPVSYHPELQEQNWGQWEAMTIAHIKKQYSEELERRVALGWKFAAPGGETRQKVLDRTLLFLQNIQQRHTGEKILIVCHQGVIKALLYHITGRKFLPGEDPLLQHNCLHFLSYLKDNWTVGDLNISRQYQI